MKGDKEGMESEKDRKVGRGGNKKERGQIRYGEGKRKTGRKDREGNK